MKTAKFYVFSIIVFFVAHRAFAQNALNFGSATLVSTDQAMRGLDPTTNTVPFSDHAPRSPALNYQGSNFYGGAWNSGGTLGLWKAVDDANGDYLEFQLSNPPLNGAAVAIFLWSRDDFLAPFRDGNVALASANPLSFIGRRFGTNISSEVRFLVQDFLGNYYISASSIGAIPASNGTVTISTLSTSQWVTYTPPSATLAEAIGTTSISAPSGIFAAGVRLKITKTGTDGGTITAGLKNFQVNATAIASTDDNIETVLGVSGRAVSQNKVNLTWPAVTQPTLPPLANLAKYVVSRGRSPGIYDLNFETAVNAFQDFRLSPATAYYYKVTWYDDKGHSASSDEVKVVTDISEGTVARHPSIVATLEEIADLKNKAATLPWKSWYARMKARATSDGAKDPSVFDENNANFINCKDRGDSVIALATVWLVDGDQVALTNLQRFFDNMPAPPSLPGENPSISDQNHILTPHSSPTQKLCKCYYESSLYVSYATLGYALAYDLVYNDLTGEQRTRYADKMVRHARAIYDGIPSALDGSGKPTYKEYIDYKANNWVDVMAAGLAAAGAALRDYNPQGAGGSIFLAKAYSKYADVNAGTLATNIHVKGNGAFMEGETYSAFTGYWTSVGIQCFRAANYGTYDFARPGTTAPSSPPYYQNWLGYRLANYTLAGRVPLFEAGRDTGSDAERWMRSSVFDLPDADKQAKMLWLLDNYYSGSTDMDVAFYRYPIGPTASGTTFVKSPIVVKSYVDRQAGLAFLRRSTAPGSVAGDDSKILALTATNRPFAGTLPNPKYDPSVTDQNQPEFWPRISLDHARNDAGSFEVWAYGAYAANEPGYDTTGDATADLHAEWVAKQAEAHNTVSFVTTANPAGTSPNRIVPSNGFQSWSLGHRIEYVRGSITDPYTLKEGDLARNANFNGVANLPSPLPAPDGSVARAFLLAPPIDATSAGYVILFEDVCMVQSSTTVRSYLHGMGSKWLYNGAANWETTGSPSSNLTVAGQGAVWSQLPLLAGALPAANTTTVGLKAYLAVPHVIGGNVYQGLQTKTYAEYWLGKPVTDVSGSVTNTNSFNADFTYSASTGATWYPYVTVIYPSQTTSTPPTIADLLNTNSQVVGASIGSTDIAATLVSGTSQTVGSVTSNALWFFVRKNGTALDCYFADCASSLIYGGYGFSAANGQIVTICMDRYDPATSPKRLRGTVAYTSANSAWTLLLKDGGLNNGGLPITATSGVITNLDTGATQSVALDCSVANRVGISMPASVGSGSQFEIEITYP